MKTLGSASWRELLPYWRGLGYYARGRNMLAAAKAVAGPLGGHFPNDIEGLRALPGIGKYTAAAIASFAFGKEVAALDTNMKRVVRRATGCSEKEIEKYAAAIFHGAGKKSAAMNHALMDVGALFCTSREIRCDSCPLQTVCVSAEKPGLRGVPAKRKSAAVKSKSKTKSRAQPDIVVAAACIHRGGRYLVARRKSGKWEFPGGKKEDGEDVRACLKREIKEELGIEISVRPPFWSEDFEKNGKLHRLYFCRSQILRGEPKCLEHSALGWAKRDELARYNLAETNLPAAAELAERFAK